MAVRLTKIFFAFAILFATSLSLYAQNKDIDKGKGFLTKAMEQSDATKRQDYINKAIESFQKGGMKREMYALIGEAFLEKKDYVNASSNYSRCDKPEKKEGMKKIAEAFVEDAFSGEEKQQAKNLKKAMDYYTKADAAKEGARAIGDRFYNLGFDNYMRALDYYLIGDAAVKIEQIAKEYFDKGGDNEAKSAEIYLKMKNADGYKKGGDIYYARKEYGKAIEAYIAGANVEGIQKYADYLYAEHRGEEADALYMRLADAMSDNKDDEGLEKLAAKIMNKGSYALAAKLYEKAGNSTNADKCKAYDDLVNFRIDEAKAAFTGMGDANMVKLLTDNEKILTPLKDLAENMEDLKKGAPFITPVFDSLTGQSITSKDDEKMRDDYYKSIKDQVIKVVSDVAANYAKLSDANLRKYARERFLQFGAVRSILDKESFVVKKQKQDIKVKDLIL